MKNISILIILLLLASCRKDECCDREQLDLNPRIVKELDYKDLKTMMIEDEKGVSTSYNVFYDHNRVSYDAPFVCEEYLEINIRNSINDFHAGILSRAQGAANMIQVSLPNTTKFIGNLQLILDDKDGYSLPSYNQDGKLTIHSNHVVNNTFFAGKVVEISYPESSPQSIKHFYYSAGYGIIRIENYAGESLSFRK